MTIHEAVHALVGFPHLVAFRMPGPQLTLTRQNMMVDHQGPKLRRYVASFNDVVSVDWRVMTQSDFAAMLTQAAETLRGQREAAEVEPVSE